MKERSYRLAQYEIILESNGGIWWKAHGGFADAKSGKCFIEGNVLFLGPSEENEPGCLKNEFLEYRSTGSLTTHHREIFASL